MAAWHARRAATVGKARKAAQQSGGQSRASYIQYIHTGQQRGHQSLECIENGYSGTLQARHHHPRIVHCTMLKPRNTAQRNVDYLSHIYKHEWPRTINTWSLDQSYEFIIIRLHVSEHSCLQVSLHVPHVSCATVNAKVSRWVRLGALAISGSTAGKGTHGTDTP